jgi:hypothetical protein
MTKADSSGKKNEGSGPGRRRRKAHQPSGSGAEEPVTDLIPLGVSQRVGEEEGPEREPRFKSRGPNSKRLEDKIVEAAASEGELPHEFLLRIMRGGVVPQDVINVKTGEVEQVFSIPSLEQRIDAAKAAAPYFAPKLQPVEVWKGMDNDELDRFIEEIAPEAGFSLGYAGAGATGEGASVSAPQAHPAGRPDHPGLQPGDGPDA